MPHTDTPPVSPDGQLNTNHYIDSHFFLVSQKTKQTKKTNKKNNNKKTYELSLAGLDVSLTKYIMTVYPLLGGISTKQVELHENDKSRFAKSTPK